MQRLAAAMLATMLALSAGSIANAATATGTTTFTPVGAVAVAGSSVNVDASVVSDIPVVPYEYSIRNECNFAGRTNGRPDSTQTDAIVNWLFSDPTNTIPHAIMPIHFTTIPAGSFCKVFLIRNNQVVKGSVTTYTVQ